MTKRKAISPLKRHKAFKEQKAFHNKSFSPDSSLNSDDASSLDSNCSAIRKTENGYEININNSNFTLSRNVDFLDGLGIEEVNASAETHFSLGTAKLDIKASGSQETRFFNWQAGKWREVETDVIGIALEVEV